MTPCPECRKSIGNNAKRCPYCTTIFEKSYNTKNGAMSFIGSVIFCLIIGAFLKLTDTGVGLPWILIFIIAILFGAFMWYETNKD